jgi:hypothetical protein
MSLHGVLVPRASHRSDSRQFAVENIYLLLTPHASDRRSRTGV